MITNIRSIGAEIQVERSNIKRTMETLLEQADVARHLIPIMESHDRVIVDSLKFTLDSTLVPTPDYF